jgi:DNA-directed RNA polymerase beta' subunit
LDNPQCYCLTPQWLGYDRHSETERVLVSDEGLTIQSLLMIQSGPLGNQWDSSGDEMNMHMPQDEEARVELEQLALNAKHAISPANNAAIIGLFQDSLLGAFQLTRPNVKFDPRTAMNLLAFYDDFDPQIIPRDRYMSPYEVLTAIMPPLSLRMNNKLHDGSKPDEDQVGTIVEIKDGLVVRGQMDSSVFGATSVGLVQSIHTDYGYKRMTKFIDSIQTIITEYMKQAGFSAGVSDLIADNETKKAIIAAIDSKKEQAKRLIDMVLTGTFENNTGKSNLEHFEMEVNAILNTAQDEAGKLGRQKLARTNRFVTMVNAGSKGKNLNIAQMISCLGQQNVDGKRIPYGFEHRTLPHYSKFDDAPEARGFVENSFVGGLTPQEMFFHAMGGRVGLIDTAVKSVSWDTPIIIMKGDTPTYTPIGKWIDALMKDNKRVSHESKLNMELLDIEEHNITIPTMDYHGNVSWKPVSAITRHDAGDKLYKITTNSGRSVIVTASKSLLVWIPELNEFREKYTADIRVGDGVPTTLYLPSFNDMNEIKLSDYLPKTKYIYGTDLHKAIELMHEEMKYNKKIPSGWWNLTNGVKFTLPYHSKASLNRSVNRSNISRLQNKCVYPFVSKLNSSHIPDTFELSYENGVFIGLFIAEGDISKTQIRITNNDETIIEFVKQWFAKYDITTSTTSYINKIGGLTTTTKASCTILADFIKQTIGHKAENKNIPDFAYTSNIEFIKGIISGYFSGDGYVSKNSIDCSTASKRLIYDIAYLCNRFGIFTKISVSQLKHNNVGTLNIKKSYRLSIKNIFGKLFSENITLIHPEKNIKMKNIVWTRKSIVNIHNNVVIDPIASIEDVPVEEHPKMYDLTIPETFNFALANGLQVRDTASTGYIQRRLIKSMEDLKACYDMTVRNSKDKIIQFRYGDDAVDAMKIETQKLPILTMDTDQIYDHYVIVPKDMMKTYKTIFTAEVVDADHKKFHKEIEKEVHDILDIRSDILHNVFGDLGLDEDRFTVPVHFNRIIMNVKNQMGIDNNSVVDITPMEALRFVRSIYTHKLSTLHYAPPTKLFELMYFYHLTPKNILVRHRYNKDALIYLLEQIVLQYKKSLVHAGEMVGIVAAQSIGEPTTQLSLLRTERIKVIKKHKTTGNVSVISDEIGTFCDRFINDYPEQTFNTGHKDSVETIIDNLDTEYYIPSVSHDEKVQWTRISHVSRHIVNGDMVRVKTRSGREVHTTLAHSHLILKNGSVVPIKAADLTLGTRIPICGLLPEYMTSITEHYTIEPDKQKYVLHSATQACNMALYLNTKGIHTHINDNIIHIQNTTSLPVIWDEIVEIEKYTPPQTEYVYDFTVPTHQTFMTEQGIFVHNTLNTFHSAGNSANSNATRGVPRIEEILSLTSNQKSSTTVVFMRPEVQHEQQQAKTIQNLVENTILADIVEKTSIHYDPNPEETTIDEDVELMEQYREFIKLFVLEGETTEQNLSKWIIRIVFNKTEMLERGITMEDVNYALKHAYPDTFHCVYSDYNADKLVMRINLTTLPNQQEKVKKDEQKKMVHYTKLKAIDITDDIYYMKTTQMNILNNVVLKGIKGIKKANLRNIKSKLVEVDGEFKKSNMWVLDTVGTNLLDILAMDDIDTRRTYSNNIIEMNDVLGIEAARQSIYMELNEVMEFGGTYINYHHLGLLVDRMTCNSWLVAISRNGVNNDDVGVISKASFEQTPEMFFNAARYAELDNMRGVSANVMCGQEGYFGTSSFQLVLDMDKVMEQQAASIREEVRLNELLKADDPTQKCAIQNIRISTVSTNVLKAADIGVDNGEDEYELDF